MSQRFTGGYRVGSSYDFASNAGHTMCGWIYLNSLTGADAVVCYLSTSSGSNSNSFFLLYGSSGGGFFGAWDQIGGSGPYYAIASSPSANTWYHLAVTSTTGSFITYLNGTQVTSAVTPNITGRANFTYQHLGFASDAVLQDVMVFGDVLTAAEIRQVMLTNAPIARVAPYAWYKLANASPLTDSSGNSHTLGGGTGSIADGPQIIMGLGPASTNASGSAAAAGGSALVPAGTTRATGSATNQYAQTIALTVSSTTRASGSAQHVTGAALAAASTTRSAGTIAGVGSGYAISIAVDGVSSTRATGAAAAAGSASIAAVGTTSTPSFALARNNSIVPRQVGGARSRRSACALTGRREVRR
jgi:hypothetical protein